MNEEAHGILVNALTEINYWTGEKEVASRMIEALSLSGFAIVPKDPTNEMIIAGRYEIGVSADSGSFQHMAIEGYKSMILQYLNVQGREK